MLAQQKIVLEKNGALVGQTIKVLVDAVNPRKKTAVARHAGQAPDIDGRVMVSKFSGVPGEVLTVRVEDFNYYDLMGKVEKVERAVALKQEAGVRVSLPVVGRGARQPCR